MNECARIANPKSIINLFTTTTTTLGDAESDPDSAHSVGRYPDADPDVRVERRARVDAEVPVDG